MNKEIKIVLDKNWLDEKTLKYKCPICDKLYSKNGICSHIWRSHGNGINHGEKTGLGQKGRIAWNKNLNKLTDERLQKQAKTYSIRYKNGEYGKSAFVNYIQNNRNDFLKNARNGGKKSASSQKRRSLNEILFYEMCQSHFVSVKNNIPCFNGWDADIIIEDLNIAILWNGIWHYKKIKRQQSLLQIQTRDKIKLKEIKKCGYKAYIIKDLGKFNFDFVKNEFEKFLNSLEKGI